MKAATGVGSWSFVSLVVAAVWSCAPAAGDAPSEPDDPALELELFLYPCDDDELEPAPTGLAPTPELLAQDPGLPAQPSPIQLPADDDSEEQP